MEKKMSREMKISGRGLKNEYTFQVEVVYDTEADIENVYKSAFAHDVVRIQNNRLSKLTDAQLAEIEATGKWSITCAELNTVTRIVDPVAATLKKAEKMSPEELAAFIAQLEAMKK